MLVLFILTFQLSGHIKIMTLSNLIHCLVLFLFHFASVYKPAGLYFVRSLLNYFILSLLNLWHPNLGALGLLELMFLSVQSTFTKRSLYSCKVYVILFQYAKSQSLPAQATQNYPEMMQEQHNMWEFERRSRSRTPEASDRPRSLSAGAATRQR